MDRLVHSEVTQKILGCAIEVHRHLGPGLLESAYRECMLEEMSLQGLAWAREVSIPLTYKDPLLPVAYRADLVVEDKVIIELKAIEKLLPIHEAQLLSYLRLAKLRVGLLLNFNMPTLRAGLRRIIL